MLWWKASSISRPLAKMLVKLFINALNKGDPSAFLCPLVLRLTVFPVRKSLTYLTGNQKGVLLTFFHWSTALLFDPTAVHNLPHTLPANAVFLLSKVSKFRNKALLSPYIDMLTLPQCHSTMKGLSVRAGFSPCRSTHGEQRSSLNSMAASHSCCSLRVPVCSF